MILALTFASPVLAQTQRAQGTLTVERAVGVSEISRMVFNASATASESASGEMAPPEQTTLSAATRLSADAPAVIRVSGDPGRSYRVNLPRSIEDPKTNATISGFSVWSHNSGDITESLTARMDETGRDTLRVSGFLSRLAFTDVTAAVPIVVNYE